MKENCKPWTIYCECAGTEGVWNTGDVYKQSHHSKQHFSDNSHLLGS